MSDSVFPPFYKWTMYHFTTVYAIYRNGEFTHNIFRETRVPAPDSRTASIMVDSNLKPARDVADSAGITRGPESVYSVKSLGRVSIEAKLDYVREVDIE